MKEIWTDLEFISSLGYRGALRKPTKKPEKDVFSWSTSAERDVNRYHGMINGALSVVKILCFLLVAVISCQSGAAGLLSYDHMSVVYGALRAAG